MMRMRKTEKKQKSLLLFHRLFCFFSVFLILIFHVIFTVTVILLALLSFSLLLFHRLFCFFSVFLLIFLTLFLFPLLIIFFSLLLGKLLQCLILFSPVWIRLPLDNDPAIGCHCHLASHYSAQLVCHVIPFLGLGPRHVAHLLSGSACGVDGEAGGPGEDINTADVLQPPGVL